MRRLATGVLVLTLAACGGGSTAERPEVMQRAAIDFCRERVEAQLKAPATAEYPDDEVVTGPDRGPWEIKGSVDAENSFGAKIRTAWTCSAHMSDDGKTVYAKASLAG